MQELRILVTGAAGFIGSNLCAELIKQGAQVIGYDNLYTGNMSNLFPELENENFQFIKADIRNTDKLNRVMQDIDIVFHEAAQTSVAESVEKPEFCNDVNVNGTLNVLNTARKNNVEKIVFASSAAIYGDEPTLPKKENMFVQPKSPYGVSKMAAEAYMVSYSKVYGMNTTSLRYFNVYGPKQRDSPYSGVLSIFTSKIFRDQNPIIFGDGSQTRDYIYVKDVVKANILAANSKKASGSVLNIATGIATDLTSLTKKLISACQKNSLKIEYSDERPGDVLHSYADITLAKDLLNFEPDYTIDTGLKDYIEDYIKNM